MPFFRRITVSTGWCRKEEKSIDSTGATSQVCPPSRQTQKPSQFQRFLCVCPEPVLTNGIDCFDRFLLYFLVLRKLRAYGRLVFLARFAPFIYNNDHFTKTGSGQT